MRKAILAFLAGWVFVSFGSIVQAQVISGQPAPDFTLTDSHGKAYSLSNFKGKFVVLEWINHECPFVRKHYDSGNMQSLQKEFTAKNVFWLSINSSAQGKEGYVTPEQANLLIKEKGASPTAFLLDPDGVVGKLYGAKTTPHMYVVDPEGILVYQGAIDDKASADPADIPDSKNYVRVALDAAMAKEPVAEAATKSYGCSVKY